MKFILHLWTFRLLLTGAIFSGLLTLSVLGLYMLMRESHRVDGSVYFITQIFVVAVFSVAQLIHRFMFADSSQPVLFSTMLIIALSANSAIGGFLGCVVGIIMDVSASRATRHVPNNALQRTEAGGRIGSEFKP